MRRVAVGIIVLALLLAGSGPLGLAENGDVAAYSDVVLVSNSKSGTVDMIDADTFDVLRTVDIIPEGKAELEALASDRDPAKTANGIVVNELAGDNYAQDLDLSPDGKTLYVARGHLADVAAFDLTSEPAEQVWTASVDGFRADHMTISPDGERLFVADLTEYQVIALGADDGSRIGTVPSGQYAHGVNVVAPASLPSTASPENEVSPNGDCVFQPVEAQAGDEVIDEEDRTCLYVASIGDITLIPRPVRANHLDPASPVLAEPYSLTIADADTLEVLRKIEFPDGIRPAAFDLAGEEMTMYYQESGFHGIVEYDLAQEREIRRVQLPIDEGVSEDDYSFESPHHGLAISPDASTLCAAGRASDYVALVETETMRERALVDVGDAPSWAINGPDGKTCWVSNTGSEAEAEQPTANTVSVISYDDEELVATIDTGDGPKHLLRGSVPADVVG